MPAEVLPTKQGSRQCLITPNRSLSANSAIVLFILIAAILLIVCGYFLSIGAWLVLPFAGLEILLIIWVALNQYHHHRDYQLIEVADEQITITTNQGKSSESIAFPCYWLRIEWRNEPGRAGGDNRLLPKLTRAFV